MRRMSPAEPDEYIPAKCRTNKSRRNMVAADSKRIDWMITLVPFILIMALAVYLFVFPEQANGVISQVRFFFGDTVGLYYLVIGLGVLIVSVFRSSVPTILAFVDV